MSQKNRILKLGRSVNRTAIIIGGSLSFLLQFILSAGLLGFLIPGALASENVPHRPFAQGADLPDRGQFIIGVVYEESEAYHIWAGHNSYNVTTRAAGESYGIDVNQGYVAIQYGLTDRWAADVNV